MNNLKLTDLISVDILQRIQDSFASYIGIAAVITDDKGVPVTKGSGFTDFCNELTRKNERGLKRCEECDKKGAFTSHETGKPAVYQCHTGLIDFAAPVILNDKVIGSVVGGQVRPGDLDEAQLRQTAHELGIDPNEYVKAAEKTYCLSMEQVEKAAVFLSEIAKCISDMAYESWCAIDKSRKMEKAARSQSNFITGLTDDLRVSMRGWLDSFRKTSGSAGDGKLGNEMNEILSKGQEVFSVINSAVDYMKVAGGNAEFSEVEYEIRTLVSDTLRSLEGEAGRSQVTLEASFADDLPEAFIGNSGRIGQIISKLVMNGIHYAGSGGKVAVHAASRKELYSESLIIKVSNSGGCMDDHIKTKLNEYLEAGDINIFGGDDETAQSLEFPLIVLLTKQMYGKVSVDVTEDMMTEFTLVFPQLPADNDNNR